MANDKSAIKLRGTWSPTRTVVTCALLMYMVLLYPATVFSNQLAISDLPSLPITENYDFQNGSGNERNTAA